MLLGVTAPVTHLPCENPELASPADTLPMVWGQGVVRICVQIWVPQENKGTKL